MVLCWLKRVLGSVVHGHWSGGTEALTVALVCPAGPESLLSEVD